MLQHCGVATYLVLVFWWRRLRFSIHSYIVRLRRDNRKKPRLVCTPPCAMKKRFCCTSGRKLPRLRDVYNLKSISVAHSTRQPVHHLLLSSNKPTCGSSSTCSLAYTYLFTRNFSGKGLFAARVTWGDRGTATSAPHPHANQRRNFHVPPRSPEPEHCLMGCCWFLRLHMYVDILAVGPPRCRGAGELVAARPLTPLITGSTSVPYDSSRRTAGYRSISQPLACSRDSSRRCVSCGPMLKARAARLLLFLLLLLMFPSLA